MRRFRRGARPRRTHCGTMREGNDAGADAAGLECRDLREWSPGSRCAAVQVYRTASHERSPAPRGEAAGSMERVYFFHGEESPCFFILYATCRGVHPRIFAARAITQPADASAVCNSSRSIALRNSTRGRPVSYTHLRAHE